MITFRDVLGPSNSQKKMFCHVLRRSCPFCTGIISDGPTRPAFICASPFPSILSCSHCPAGAMVRRHESTSVRIFGSQFSWIMIAAVAPSAYNAHNSQSRPCADTIACTCAVISTISSREFVLKVMVALISFHCLRLHIGNPRHFDIPAAVIMILRQGRFYVPETVRPQSLSSTDVRVLKISSFPIMPTSLPC